MALELKANWQDNLHIATPCRANWEKMDEVDGDRVRFCRSCEKNVYNVSLMSSREAKDLIMAHEGHLCLRLARRRDGTLITTDCPVGQTTRRARRFWGSGIAALLFAVIPSPLSDSLAQASAWCLRTIPGLEDVANKVETTPGRSLVAWWKERRSSASDYGEVMGGGVMAPIKVPVQPLPNPTPPPASFSVPTPPSVVAPLPAPTPTPPPLAFSPVTPIIPQGEPIQAPEQAPRVER